MLASGFDFVLQCAHACSYELCLHCLPNILDLVCLYSLAFLHVRSSAH